MVIFANGADARITEACILEVAEAIDHKTEFKFSKSRHLVRDAFFQAVAGCPFTMRALIVRKEQLHSPKLRSDTDCFYNYFVRMLMAHDNGALTAARIRIDSSGSRDFQRSLGGYLRRQLGERITDVKMSDSAGDRLMQLADMCIGAVTRAERDRDNPTRWRDMLGTRVADIWHFG